MFVTDKKKTKVFSKSNIHMLSRVVLCCLDLFVSYISLPNIFIIEII